MGPSVFASPLSGTQPSLVDNNFYESLTQGKPQIEIPIIRGQSVAVAQTANLKQNTLSNTGALRTQINQTKSAFLDTMKAAREEAGQAIMEATSEAVAGGANISTGQVAAALFPNKPCEALNFAIAFDPTFLSTMWSSVNNVISQCPNHEVAQIVENALSKLHEASKAKEGQAPKAQANWQEFNQGDLKRFLTADPMKDDNTGRQIAAVELAVIDMERNKGDLEANYTTTGDVYDKVMGELDRGLVAEMIAPRKCAAECLMLISTLPFLRGVTADNENTPELEEAQELSRKLAEAAPKMEPTALQRLLQATMDPFRKAA